MIALFINTIHNVDCVRYVCLITGSTAIKEMNCCGQTIVSIKEPVVASSACTVFLC